MFVDKMEEILGSRPTTTPPVLIDTSAKQIVAVNAEEERVILEDEELNYSELEKESNNVDPEELKNKEKLDVEVLKNVEESNKKDVVKTEEKKREDKEKEARIQGRHYSELYG